MNTLNFLRQNPIENWIDYFVNPDKFSGLLDSEDTERIVSLFNQFVTQAQTVDKENDVPRLKDLDLRVQSPRELGDEDLNYGRKKATRLWLCAFACFASFGWNFELARTHCNAITLQTLLIRLLKFAFSLPNATTNDDTLKIIFGDVNDFVHANNSPQKLFAAWLYGRWVLHVDTKDSVLDSVFKPTVSNPSNQHDANLVLADQLRSCIAEIRQKLKEAVVLLVHMIDSKSDYLIIPTKDCFLEMLKDEKLSPTLEGDTYISILTAWDPEINAVKITETDWKILTRFDLVCDHFAAGRLMDSRQNLIGIAAEWPNYGSSDPKTKKFACISFDSLMGYCNALKVGFPHSNASLKQPQLLDFKSLTSPWLCNEDRSSIEGFVEEYLNGFPVVKNALTKFFCNADSNLAIKRFADVVASPNTTASRKMYAKVALQFFSLQGPNFAQKIAEVEKELGSRSLCLQSKQLVRRPVSRIPDASKVLVLLSGTVPFWRLLLSYDVNEIKILLQQMGGKFTHACRYDTSKVIGDAVLPKVMKLPNYHLIFLLLGKLENLAKIGDMEKINLFCTECVNELYAIGKEQEVQLRFAFDFVRVKLKNWHEKTYKSTNNESVLRTTQELQKVVKAIVETALVKSAVSALSKMMIHIVTFLINTNEWDYLMKCSDKLRSPFLDVAKVLAAFITADQSRAKKIADGPWWQIMHPTFEDVSSKRRYDGSSSRELSKQLISRSDFISFLRYIMEPRSIAFLLSFLGKMYNCVVSLSAASDGLNNIFVEHNNFWQLSPSCFSNFNVAYICECLDVILVNALILNPINAFWLRSCADYNFANERYEDALILYMETCVACSESLIQPLPDNVVDDLMWRKIQYCLRFCGLETLAMIVCQQMRDPTEHYVSSAKVFFDSEGSTLDACAACFPLIMSMEVAEFLNDAYEKLGLGTKAQTLIKAVSVPELNTNNPNQSERYRRRERLMRLLCSQILQIHL